MSVLPGSTISDMTLKSVPEGADLIPIVDSNDGLNKRATLASLIANVTTAQSNIYYVSKSGDDGNDGQSIETAVLTFTQALLLASAGDAIVCLDGGTYTEALTVTDNTPIFAPNVILTNAGAATLTLNASPEIMIGEVINTNATGSAIVASQSARVVARYIKSEVGGLTVSVSANAPTIVADRLNGPINVSGGSLDITVHNLEGSLSVTGTVNGLIGSDFYGNTVYNFRSPINLPSMTSTARDALTPANGWMIYNTTTDKAQVRAAGAWVDLH